MYVTWVLQIHMVLKIFLYINSLSITIFLTIFSAYWFITRVSAPISSGQRFSSEGTPILYFPKTNHEREQTLVRKEDGRTSGAPYSTNANN